MKSTLGRFKTLMETALVTFEALHKDWTTTKIWALMPFGLVLTMTRRTPTMVTIFATTGRSIQNLAPWTTSTLC